jgi:small subunit ribosomal protein S6
MSQGRMTITAWWGAKAVGYPLGSSCTTCPAIRRGPERTVAGSGGKGQRPVRPYEVMIILEATLEDDEIQAVIGRATEVISSTGGNPGRVEKWGKRRFAYELHHRWEGYYILLEASAEPTTMAALDRALTLADEVVRHKVIRLPDVVAGRARTTTAVAEVAAEDAATPEAVEATTGAET